MTDRYTNKARRRSRHLRVRKTVRGTRKRPRLAVFRSLNHIYAQVVDDVKGETLAAASSLESEAKGQRNGNSKTGMATVVGSLLAGRARKRRIKSVVFDRGGHQYHGRVRALAEAAREGGLIF